ncbi:hypothetical protein R1sor_012190 [Riccia sorocarpa]|uniref:Uncharacterized protein n=1 Tax=Riccia sorocarpa TaxID=122646 RepID=A0ABD3I6E7_9MARC
MHAGVIVRTGGSTLDLLKVGAKIELNLYSKLYELSDIPGLRKSKALPHLCTFCRGWNHHGLIFGFLNEVILITYLVFVPRLVLTIWSVGSPKCVVPLLVSWVFDFNLCREVDLKALVERYSTCQDTRSFPPSAYDDLHEFAITRVNGNQFRGWSRREGGVPPADWKDIWNYPRRSFWICYKSIARHEVNAHNMCLVTVKLHGFEVSDPVLESLCNLNSVLSFRLRLRDGLFLECIAHKLLVLSWVTELQEELVQDKKVVTIWKSGRIPDRVLRDEDFYRSKAVFKTLFGLFIGSKLWRCKHPSHGSPVAGSSTASVAGSSATRVVVSEASSASGSTSGSRAGSSSASGAGADSDDECHQCLQAPPFSSEYSVWLNDKALGKCNM